jgi:hypothetical protein
VAGYLRSGYNDDPDNQAVRKWGDLMLERYWYIACGFALFFGAGIAAAEDGDTLDLPTGLAPEVLEKSAARGATVDAEAGGEDNNINSSASAQASIENVTIAQPGSTGDISGLGGVPAGDVVIMQLNTGSGNIQQGVSATAFIAP